MSSTARSATGVLIEDKASGAQLIQQRVTDGGHGITRYQPQCDKIMRLHAQSARETERNGMGQAARRWYHRRCKSLTESI